MPLSDRKIQVQPAGSSHHKASKNCGSNGACHHKPRIFLPSKPNCCRAVPVNCFHNYLQPYHLLLWIYNKVVQTNTGKNREYLQASTSLFLGRYQRTDKGQVKVLQISSHTGTRTQSRNQLTTTRQHTPQQPGKPAASPKLTGKLTAARWPNPSAACCAKPALLPPGRLREHKFS